MQYDSACMFVVLINITCLQCIKSSILQFLLLVMDSETTQIILIHYVHNHIYHRSTVMTVFKSHDNHNIAIPRFK